MHYGGVEADECCERCATTPNCTAYTHDNSSKDCFLKKSCDFLVKASAAKSSSLLRELPPAQPTCALPDLGIGYRCDGDQLDAKIVADHGACCELCTSDPECIVFSYSNSQRMCHMRRTCYPKVSDGDYITGWAPPPTEAAVARYQVGRGYYEIEGYECVGGDKSTVIFYPLGPGPFHVVVYGHGAWGYLDGSDSWLQTVASLGLIVIAPFSGKDDSCGAKFVHDLVRALNLTKNGGADLHPALGTADWSRTGMFGHSRGGKYVPTAASEASDDLNIVAVVASSDKPAHHPKHEVPTMFMTGTLDKSDLDNSTWPYFVASNATNKVYANLIGAYHMEVQEGERLNVLSAQFLACHVGLSEQDCEIIYGTGPGTICDPATNDYQNCVVVGSSPMKTTTTTTTIATTTTSSHTSSATSSSTANSTPSANSSHTSILVV